MTDIIYIIMTYCILIRHTLFGSEFGHTDIFAQGLRKVRARFAQAASALAHPTPHKKRQRTGLEEKLTNASFI